MPWELLISPARGEIGSHHPSLLLGENRPTMIPPHSGVVVARIAVITHEFDRFQGPWRPFGERDSPYMLFDILTELSRRGHKVSVLAGTRRRPQADVAILHVDATVVPPDYVDYANRFPRCLNLGVTDISKRRVSQAVLGAGEAWHGPVIVKSNLNHHGLPELRFNLRAGRHGRPTPFPAAREVPRYDVYPARAELPPALLERPDLVVEKFMPEIVPDGFGTRFWVFCGARERCARYISPNPVVKASETIRREPVSVPEELRLLRLALGFDYGKFDFVVHQGRAVLLDANPTPGRPKGVRAMLAEAAVNLADGFEGMIGEMQSRPWR